MWNMDTFHFFLKDIHNFFSKIYRKNAKNDAMDILQNCKHAQDEDSRF